MDTIYDDETTAEIITHDIMQQILDKANILREQNEEQKMIKDSAIHYALKEIECFISIQLIFHDQENNQYKITDEDIEPSNMKHDNLQCFSIQKRRRVMSTNQDDIGQNSLQDNSMNIMDQSSDQLTAQQIMNIMNKKQGIFLTPIKDRLYVRSMIAKEKMKNMQYQDVLNNSITFYGKDNLDKKATNLFNKYVKGHSLGPLKLEQSVSPLRVQPKELVLPKNVAFERNYPQDIVEQLDGNQITISNLNLDTRKISLDISQLDYSKIKLPTAQKQSQLQLDHQMESLLHVPTYQSLYQQNPMKYDSSQLTLPTQITSSQPIIQIHQHNSVSITPNKVKNIYKMNKKEKDDNDDDGYNINSSIKDIQNKEDNLYQPQTQRVQLKEDNRYNINKIVRASSTIKSSNQQQLQYNSQNSSDINRQIQQQPHQSKFRKIGNSLDRSQNKNQLQSLSFLDKSPYYEKYLKKNQYSQIDDDYQQQQQNSLNISYNPNIYNSTEMNEDNNNMMDNNYITQNNQIDQNDSIDQSNIQQQYKKQKVMRKELSQLLLERKKQLKQQTQIKDNNNINKVTMFAPERYSNRINRSQTQSISSQSPFSNKQQSNKSSLMKEILSNMAENKNNYLYQPEILQKPNYNSNHLVKSNYLPPLRTQRLNQYS